MPVERINYDDGLQNLKTLTHFCKRRLAGITLLPHPANGRPNLTSDSFDSATSVGNAFAQKLEKVSMRSLGFISHFALHSRTLVVH